MGRGQVFYSSYRISYRFSLSARQSGIQLPITVKAVLDSITRRKYLLPAIQREFIWPEEKIVTLFDSLMKDYPIGTFLFWNLEPASIQNFQFYEFIKDYHERDRRHNPEANVRGEEGITAILDGQQRLTALNIGLKGSYADKIPWKKRDSNEAFPIRKLYLNLLAPTESEDLYYDFSFKTESEAKQRDEKYFWFEVGKVLELYGIGDVINYLTSHSLDKDFPRDTLAKLFDVINSKPVINFYQETSQDLDKVLNIFIGVNRGGTELSYSDLLLSIATAKWKKRDARKEITNFVDEINKIGDGFDLDKDFVMKSCLVLSDIPGISFKGDNFNKSNMSRIEDNWEKIKKVITLTVELVSRYGYNFQTLTSGYALIPISYYLLKKENPEKLVSSTHLKNDRNLIKKWLSCSLLKRVFGGQPDNVLTPIRETIRESHDSFPFSQIAERFRAKSKSIIFNEDDIQSFLNYEYGKAHTFSVLALLYPTLDFRNKFHQDHIFANSFFRKSELKKRNIADSKIKFFMENNDLIGNLQLLEGLPNEEKRNLDFTIWLKKTYPNEIDRNDFMIKNYIPRGIDLSLTNFEEFFIKRNQLISDQLRKLLIYN